MQTVQQDASQGTAEGNAAQATHDAAMAAVGDTVAIQGQPAAATAEAPAAATEAPQRPENVPEKFWDAEKGSVNTEAMLASYTELERKLSQPTKDDPAAADDKAAADESTDGEQPATNPVTAASAEYAEKGELSEDTYASLEKAGVTRDMVSAYIAGQEAQASSNVTALHEAAGGTESYEAMIGWAAENLSEADKAAYNSTLANPAAAKMAVAGLMSRFRSEGDFEGTTVAGGAAHSGVDAFKSGAEMRAAMADPKYKSDPAFRQTVSDRIAAAKVDLFSR